MQLTAQSQAQAAAAQWLILWLSLEVVSLLNLGRGKGESPGEYAHMMEAQTRAICDRVVESENDKMEAQYVIKLIKPLLLENIKREVPDRVKKSLKTTSTPLRLDEAVEMVKEEDEEFRESRRTDEDWTKVTYSRKRRRHEGNTESDGSLSPKRQSLGGSQENNIGRGRSTDQGEGGTKTGGKTVLSIHCNKTENGANHKRKDLGILHCGGTTEEINNGSGSRIREQWCKRAFRGGHLLSSVRLYASSGYVDLHVASVQIPLALLDRGSQKRGFHNLKRANVPISLHQPDKNIFKVEKQLDELRLLVPTWQYLKEVEGPRLVMTMKKAGSLGLEIVRKGSTQWKRLQDEFEKVARVGILNMSSRLVVIIRDQVPRGGGGKAVAISLNNLQRRGAATFATILPRLRLFELPKFLKDKLPLKKSEDKRTCRPVEPKENNLKKVPEHELMDSLSKKWVNLRDKLPGWQETIAKRLQQVQDVVTKRLPKP
ncbi:hypothetical protein AAG570_009989 [Ranatra chinensis]|uniref:Uncharacterized protein n=1 Tax=Ranatra chinensis TaxID=642074 RepID=A0ABD0YQR2_9HEMI